MFNYIRTKLSNFDSYVDNKINSTISYFKLSFTMDCFYASKTLFNWSMLPFTLLVKGLHAINPFQATGRINISFIFNFLRNVANLEAKDLFTLSAALLFSGVAAYYYIAVPFISASMFLAGTWASIFSFSLLLRAIGNISYHYLCYKDEQLMIGNTLKEQNLLWKEIILDSLGINHSNNHARPQVASEPESLLPIENNSGEENNSEDENLSLDEELKALIADQKETLVVYRDINLPPMLADLDEIVEKYKENDDPDYFPDFEAKSPLKLKRRHSI